jgi:hypothetical protein
MYSSQILDTTIYRYISSHSIRLFVEIEKRVKFVVGKRSKKLEKRIAQSNSFNLYPLPFTLASQECKKSMASWQQ